MTLVFAAAARSQTQTFERDLQLWNETQIIIPLDQKKDWNAVIWMFGRVGRDVRQVTDARIGGLITKKFNRFLTVGSGYLYRYSNPSFRLSRHEHRYLGLATITVPLGKKFTLVNRNLYQYEDRNSRPDSTVLRSRAWLKREITVAKKKFEPFVSFEQFYDLRADAFVRNRIQIGFSHKFNPKFSADFYYVRQNEGGNRARPGSLNGIGTSFRVNI